MRLKGETRIEYFYEVRNIEKNINRFEYKLRPQDHGHGAGEEEMGILLKYRFRPSQFTTEYKRSLFNIGDILGSMGGFFASLKGIGGGFTAVFAYRLLMSSLIGKLFYFRPRFNSEVKKDKKKKGKKGDSDGGEKSKKEK